MAKEDLETKSRKAVLRIDKKVTDMNNILRDLSMKVCHVIRYKGEYYSMPKGIDYE